MLSVRAFDLNGNLLASVNTDARGDYAFDSLPAGQVRLEVNVAGLRSTSIKESMSATGLRPGETSSSK